MYHVEVSNRFATLEDLDAEVQHFMEPKGSLQRSQEFSTCNYSEPD
jgi:hypothetical protein